MSEGAAWQDGAPCPTAKEFRELSELVYEHAGIDLRRGKEQLLATRLGKKLRELKLRSFREYYRYVLEDKTGEALIALVDALTTNHTSFFREPAHFEFLCRTILPVLRGRDRAAIWSAACSTGEEPYSIAFALLEEMGQEAFRKVRILATDISTKALAAAEQAVYPAERFEGRTLDRLRQYLLLGQRRWRGWYRVKRQVCAMVEFRRANLMDPMDHLGSFPVIFCRNVMIYFDRGTQQKVVRRLTERLEPGGYLLIGHSESLSGIAHSLQYVRPAVYQRPDATCAAGGARRCGR